jgi:lysophospholipase L1-like esterase
LAAKLLLAAVSMVGTVYALEWGARWLHLYTGFFLLPGADNCLQRSPSLSMEFRPHCVGEMEHTPMVTNALGMRGPELRDDGARRILAIGDSCTWGWQVGQDETYPADLQRLLDQQDGPERYQVLNAGVPGYTSYQVLVALREKGLPLKPAIVIIAVGFNDLFNTGDVVEQITNERRLMPLLRADDFLLSTSTLYRWARWNASGGNQPTGAVRVTASDYARNLREMVELSRAQGAHVLLLSFWNPRDPHTAYPVVPRDTAAALHLPLITYDGPVLDAVHPTPEGYRVLAAEIADRLRAEGWVQ